MLAGRLKRRWLADPEEAATDGQRARELYHAAFAQAASGGHHPQAYYNGINAAFMELALGRDPAGAQQIAEQVVQHCEAARQTRSDQWLLATEGEAHLYGGRYDDALALYRKALHELAEERERGSMLRQGIWVCRLLGAREAEFRLRSLHEPGAAAFPDPDEVQACEPDEWEDDADDPPSASDPRR